MKPSGETGGHAAQPLAPAFDGRNRIRLAGKRV